MGRCIGIRHRRKRTTEGEARPTMVAIRTGDKTVVYTLEDDTAELDFLKGQFPVKFREAEPGDDLLEFPEHHRVERKKRGSEDVIVMVPDSYDGLRKGDTVGMVLGGSGDRLSYALSTRGEAIGAAVFRIPPFVLAAERKDGSREDDHLMLAMLVAEKCDLFYRVTARDRELIRLQEMLIWRREAQQARIACEQRLYQRAVGRIFLSEEGEYPEGRVEDEYDKLKANDAILEALVREEGKREAELRMIVRGLDAWTEIFEDIEGCGEVIAAGIIAAIGDIRRFPSKAKLKAFCGVHVLLDGSFPRRRSGSVANWNPKARQALYLLGKQFNYRPNSDWGLELLRWKRVFRERHPEILEVNGKKRYTNGHIHNMAIWRTLTKFVERLWSDWTAIEKQRAKAA